LFLNVFICCRDDLEKPIAERKGVREAASKASKKITYSLTTRNSDLAYFDKNYRPDSK